MNMVNTVPEYSHIQCVSENAEHVEEMLNDTYRLLSWFHSIIGPSALHDYHSALTFTPPGTHLYQTYSCKFPNRMIATQGVQQHWSCLVAVLHRHSDGVVVVSYSPDGS